MIDSVKVRQDDGSAVSFETVFQRFESSGKGPTDVEVARRLAQYDCNRLPAARRGGTFLGAASGVRRMVTPGKNGALYIVTIDVANPGLLPEPGIAASVSIDVGGRDALSRWSCDPIGQGRMEYESGQATRAKYA